MKELIKNKLLAVIDTDIKAGDKIISSQENSKVIKAIERRIQAYRQLCQLIENQSIFKTIGIILLLPIALLFLAGCMLYDLIWRGTNDE